jgi:hypothetical protein
MTHLRSVLLVGCLLVLSIGPASNMLSSGVELKREAGGAECHAVRSDPASAVHQGQPHAMTSSRLKVHDTARLSMVGRILLIGVGAGYAVRKILGQGAEQ